jgi:hypothetical protein
MLTWDTIFTIIQTRIGVRTAIGSTLDRSHLVPVGSISQIEIGDYIMTASTWLRISAVLTLFFCAAHTLGYPWVGQLSTVQLEQLAGIDTVKAVTQGFARSYSDFHKGFGFYVSAMLLVQAVVLWQLGSMVKTEPRTAKFITALFAASFAVTALLDCFYFFWGPIIFSGVITLTLLVAFFKQRDSRKSSA